MTTTTDGRPTPADYYTGETSTHTEEFILETWDAQRQRWSQALGAFPTRAEAAAEIRDEEGWGDTPRRIVRVITSHSRGVLMAGLPDDVKEYMS